MTYLARPYHIPCDARQVIPYTIPWPPGHTIYHVMPSKSYHIPYHGRQAIPYIMPCQPGHIIHHAMHCQAMQYTMLWLARTYPIPFMPARPYHAMPCHTIPSHDRQAVPYTMPCPPGHTATGMVPSSSMYGLACVT